ncbi:MAG TPA: co-chaperone GroES [Actinomycetota bacterium]|nr:co-chaperone GroES [Actinomycetota bacterium]
MARSTKLRSVPERPAVPAAELAAKIRLTADRVLVRMPDETERKSKGGLVIPATAVSPLKRCVWSEVVLVGPETRNVKPGDRILFLPQTGLETDVDGDVYLLLRERDVQAITSDRVDRQTGQYL